ncbi:MAG: nicotinate-nucleotide adenylyltransferase [Chloroflexota bacterium]
MAGLGIQRLGVFGGTFDPPHWAHLVLAAEAFYQLELTKVLWVLTPYPPHKQGQQHAHLADRLDMVNAAIAYDPTFELSRVEIDRPGPHYAVDTMRILGKQYPEAERVYLMGGDSLRNLPSWHQPREFVRACHALGVVRRPDDQVDLQVLEAELPGIQSKVRFVSAPLLDISSSEIRARVHAGRHYRYFLPPEVWGIVEKRGLYRPTG